MNESNFQVSESIRRTIGRLMRPTGVVPIRWKRRDTHSWLGQHFGKFQTRGRSADVDRVIADRIATTEARGAQPLWEGYGEPSGAVRTASFVGTRTEMGRIYRDIVRARRPRVVVEFGTAFGVSGMWWLSGLEMVGSGRLLTFDPNDIWRKLAEENISSIGSRYTVVAGTFEDSIDRNLSEHEKIDLAFVDAIHTSDFVIPQFNQVVARCSPGAIVLLDDIDFSEDMRLCWNKLAIDPRVAASVELGRRVGVIELASPL